MRSRASAHLPPFWELAPVLCMRVPGVVQVQGCWWPDRLSVLGLRIRKSCQSKLHVMIWPLSLVKMIWASVRRLIKSRIGSGPAGERQYYFWTPYLTLT